jgi:hypothetical protein
MYKKYRYKHFASFWERVSNVSVFVTFYVEWNALTFKNRASYI